MKMKKLTVAQFRHQCIQLLDNVPAEGILITKGGKPIAKLIKMPIPSSEPAGTTTTVVLGDDDDFFTSGIPWDADGGHLD